MAPDVICLLSSPIQSPRRASPTPELRREPMIQRDNTHPASLSRSDVSSKRYALHADIDVLYMSDEFDTTGDISFAAPVRPPSAKRPRITAPTKKATADDMVSASSRVFGLGKSAASIRNDDPIMSSSPSHGGPPKSKSYSTSKLGDSIPQGWSFADSDDVDQYDFYSGPTLGNKAVTETTERVKLPSAKKQPIAWNPDDLDNFDVDQFDFGCEPVLRNKTTTATKEKQQPSSAKKQPVAWDPISSSAPQPTGHTPPPSRAQSKSNKSSNWASGKNVIIIDDFGDDSDSDGSDLPDLAAMLSPSYKPRTKGAGTKTGTTTTKKPLSRTTSDLTSKARKPPTSSARGLNAEECERLKLEKEAEKKRKQEEKEKEKARKQEEKEALKSKKKADKERASALAEANKVKTDRKKSTPEMIVDLPRTLSASCLMRTQQLLQDAGATHGTWEPKPLRNVVRWRRKVTAVYSEERKRWEPIPESIVGEEHVLVVLEAEEFAKLAMRWKEGSSGSKKAKSNANAPVILLENDDDGYGSVNGGGDDHCIESHARKLRKHYPTHQIIYLIEGLQALLRKNKNAHSRNFAAQVRANLPPDAYYDQGPPSSSQRRRQQKAKENQADPVKQIEPLITEDALLALQLNHPNTLIHHTDAELCTAQWITKFTENISTVPYKRVDLATSTSAQFCMERGQVKCGDTPRQVFVRMLEEINRITPAISHGMAVEFRGSVGGMVRGFLEGGQGRVEGVRRAWRGGCGEGEGDGDGDVELSGAPMGLRVSQRLFRVFTGLDESSLDI